MKSDNKQINQSEGKPTSVENNDESMLEFFQKDKRNPNHPSYKISKRWGDVMTKEEKTLEDLERLFWYNDRTQNPDLHYQFLYEEICLLRDHYFQKFIDETNLRTFFMEGKIEDLHWEGFVAKDEIVDYYLRGRKVRGNESELIKYNPNHTNDTYDHVDKGVWYDKSLYEAQELKDWVEPDLNKKTELRCTYPYASYGNKHYISPMEGAHSSLGEYKTDTGENIK